jgi:hypothetical protein
MPVFSEFLMSSAVDKIRVFVQIVSYPFEPGKQKGLTLNPAVLNRSQEIV